MPTVLTWTKIYIPVVRHLQMMLDVFLQVKTTNKLSREGRTKSRLPTKQKRWGNIALWFDPADLMQPIWKPLKSHRLIFFILHAKFILDVLSVSLIFCGALLKCVFSANCAVVWLVVGVYGEREREREREDMLSWPSKLTGRHVYVLQCCSIVLEH